MPPPKDETPEQREARLIKARKKAANSREEKMVEKYKSKVLEKVKKDGGRPIRDDEEASANRPVREEDENENENEDSDKDEESPPKPVKVGGRPKREDKEASANRSAHEEVEKKPVKAVARRPPRSKIIIEQSSDDDDVFEDKPNVIFVKRVRPKPKVPIHQPIQQPSQQQVPQQPSQQQIQQQQQQRPPPPPPQRPQLTPEKRLQMQQYINMTQGNFLPMSRPR